MNLGDAHATEPKPDLRPIRHVLFVGIYNTGPSQMAQAFFERHAPAGAHAESAGTEPAREVWPPAVQAMREVGIDLAGSKPEELTFEMQLRADWVIAIGCGTAHPDVATGAEAWEIPDPSRKPMADVRAIRDGIEAHVRELITDRIDAIRSDRAAHQLRLGRLLPLLDDEFADVRPAEEIRACADAVLERYDAAPVRSHVMTLVHRQARECLRQDTCGVLAHRETS